MLRFPPHHARVLQSGSPRGAARLARHLCLAGSLWLTACGGGGTDAPDAPDLAQIQTPDILLAALPQASTQAMRWSRTVALPAGNDNGHALGTLFSLTDEQGLPVAGAGFLHGMQSGVSLPRRQVSFFIGHNDDANSAFTQLQGGESGPYSPDALFTLAVYRDTLLAFRYKQTGRVRAFQPQTRTWVDFIDPALPDDPSSAVRNLQTVGNQLLVTYDTHVLWGGRPLQFNTPAIGARDSFYLSAYNDGALRLGVVRRTGSQSAPVLIAALVDCRWTPPGREVTDCVAREMPAGGTATMDQLLFGMHALPQGDVVAYGLNGELLNWAGGQWESMRTMQTGESWQVYATTEVDDQVLMGHYPSGGVLSLHADDGALPQVQVASLSVSGEPAVRRDEVQSLVPFGGEVLAGVWPWGEIYRGHPRRGWSRFIEAFDHSARAPDSGHPYDDLGVSNCLGQRVFQVLPWRNGFVYSTTMKNNNDECAGTFDRLPAAARPQYGRVVVVERSNALSCNIIWTGKASALTFGVTADWRMVVVQEGRELCSTPLSSPDLLQRLVAWEAEPHNAQTILSGPFGLVRR